MNSETPGDTLKKICPKCGKPVAGGRRLGSLTSFLFGASNCACPSSGDALKALPSSSENETSGEGAFCPKCGLQLATDARQGSLTGFLFQSTRCKCPRDPAFVNGQMSAQFWKLKQAGGGSLFTSAAAEPNLRSSSSIDLAPGAIIGGVYKIIELIGRGGMGEVYLARHETLGKKCALKVIPPEQVTEMGWQRFQIEARAIAKLDHINLVRVTDLGIHDGCLPFYAMDYVEGKNLADRVAEDGPLPLQTTLEVFMQVCDGVECAHRHGILHRDLKPANIMLVATKSGKTLAKVLDFGLAKLTKNDRSSQSLTAVGEVFGSPFYMSPEQCNSDRIDNRSDIYSLGCTIFECLTGQPLFSGHLASAIMFSHLESDPPSLESVVGSGVFPTSLEVVIAKLLRKNPAERYQNLSQLKSDFQLVLDGQDVLPVYVSRTQPRTNQADREEGHTKAPKPLDRKLSPTLIGGLILTTFVCGGLYCLASLFLANKSDNPLAKVSSLSVPVASRSQNDQARTKGLSAKSGAVLNSGNSSTALDANAGPTAPIEGAMDDIEEFSEDLDIVKAKLAKYRANPHSAHLHFKQNTKPLGFHFPSDFMIGSIAVGSDTPVMATGLVLAPKDADVHMYLSTITRSWPEVLDKFGPEDLTGLDIVCEEPQKEVYKVIGWKKLNQLAFFNSLTKASPGIDNLFDESKIADKDLPIIDRLTRLKSLGLCGHSVSGKAILKMRLLDSVETLKVKGIADVESLLKGLPAKDNIRQVWLIAQGITDDQLESLVHMKNLDTLWIRRSKLTPASIQYFKRMTELKHLHLDTDWPSNIKDHFRMELPVCEFEPSVDTKYWQILPGKKYEYRTKGHQLWLFEN